MKTAMEHFRHFSKIPRCSFDADEMRDFIVKFAKSVGYSVKVDKADNILCIKQKPLICLQSHYDMVCLGDAPNVEIYEKRGWIKAENSTLGADNGIGVALMMSMMERYDNIETLFTSNEEVGLIGANNLGHKIAAPYLLNLDSEEEGNIFIGCAGGVDIVGEISAQKKSAKDNLMTYEISVKDLQGGHSGVDIDKNIPNAIKILAQELADNDCELMAINGGERINSIPKNAYATICAPKNFTLKNRFLNIKKVEKSSDILTHSRSIISMLQNFTQGVRSFNDELKIPNESINLSTIRTDNNKIIVEFFARAMEKKALEELKKSSSDFLKNFGFDVKTKNFSAPWRANITPFAKRVRKIMQKFFRNVEFKAMHAGLECGIFESINPNIQVASIGPNIKFPHSFDECCEIASVEKLEMILEELMADLK
ncbi:MAG: M20/M25/M40 family metallo-hydrolase [Campylobacteraceae bacterium]|jgi:dipeptidase D|nr:M20/M25/M40 family metallo-hydrolase [Campylobacteraceae bacterium]